MSKKVLKKMKLNELQEENLGSKESRNILGGYGCGCASTCLDYGSDVENAISDQAVALKSCGC